MIIHFQVQLLRDKNLQKVLFRNRFRHLDSSQVQVVCFDILWIALPSPSESTSIMDGPSEQIALKISDLF